MNILGERIFELRKKKKLTQEKLGENIGVGKQIISKYEKGTKTPSLETIEKLADFFEVPIDYLLGKSNNPKSTSTNIRELLDNQELHWDGRKLSSEELESMKALLEVAVQRMLTQTKKD
ncbi:helix-turn-helix transcriptional regulator [Bacillus pseudomycoides]|uniref:Helix-turn-helix transcriptional regulator n=1 Tax=Bacillus bingmayongensis TaxID=1150157 RepID=A0ABU5JYG0_9BACI|nr:helix-turn-helix transcriptional regulator [Bacillus pseudomycoides]